VNIVKLKMNDSTHYDALYDLMVEYIAETDSHQNIKTPRKIIPNITKSMIDKIDENRLLQIVYVEDEPIAFCYVKIDRIGDKGYIRPNWGYIMEFFVKKTHRRKGIGKKLVKQCEKFFEEKGVKNIWLTADAVTGIPFWLACNFIETGEFSLENNQQIMSKKL